MKSPNPKGGVATRPKAFATVPAVPGLLALPPLRLAELAFLPVPGRDEPAVRGRSARPGGAVYGDGMAGRGLKIDEVGDPAVEGRERLSSVSRTLVGDTGYNL